MASPGAARQIGRYLLFGEIAAGGMATVHFGRLSGPAGFSRTVAIKRLHAQYAKDPDFVSMFLDEARLAARIRHPNVVPTLDVVQTDEEMFLVMEYVQGESLAKLLRAVRSMMTTSDVRIVATIMSGVLHGLHAAHEAKSEQGEPLNIVHRDVSPQNILVGTDGVPRVLDFGVAKAVGRLQTTRQGQIKGKLSYMAPEQLHNQPVTRQSDIYAAAVVTWESLTGQRLFRGDNEAAIVTAVLQAPIRPPSHVGVHVPLAFDRVVLRGLERDPSYRYQTAREMALDLERCAGIAPASEIGEWVESLAHDELFKRNAHIAEIESVSSESIRQRAVPAVADMPTTVTDTGDYRPSASMRAAAAIAPQAQEPRSDVSSIAVAPILSTAPRKPRGHLPIIAGIGGVLGIVILVMALVLGRGGKTAGAEGTTDPSASAAAIGPLVPPVESPPPPPADSASTAGLSPTDVPTATPPAPTTATPPPSPPPRRWAPPPSPRPQPPRPASGQGDCDPPFWIDAQGHKKYKPACL
ncbi:MAG TPA: serine/threonine-protein kinase [Polyangiaceae bacterium]|nr:serine/threonine-protein kinase [Polyangiaceae bacterium]